MLDHWSETILPDLIQNCDRLEFIGFTAIKIIWHYLYDCIHEEYSDKFISTFINISSLSEFKSKTQQELLSVCTAIAYLFLLTDYYEKFQAVNKILEKLWNQKIDFVKPIWLKTSNSNLMSIQEQLKECHNILSQSNRKKQGLLASWKSTKVIKLSYLLIFSCV